MDGIEKENEMKTKKIFTSIVLSSLLLGAVTLAQAEGVTPPLVDIALTVGDSEVINKEVTTPTGPSNLDLVLMIDLSGSYVDDMENIRTMAPLLFDHITDPSSGVDSAQFGIASFVDVPLYPWGVLGDYTYKLDQGLTGDRTTWIDAVNGLSTYSGWDRPQNQYIAFYQVATGEGMDADGNGLIDAWDVSPGGAPAWRDNATHVVAMTTDASFHTPGDSNCDTGAYPCPMPYPGPDRDATVAALVAQGIKVIAIKAPGAEGEMDYIAEATGGSVQTTGSTSEEIGEAIIAALDDLTGSVTYSVIGCAPLSVSLTPAQHDDVPGEATVAFVETITVPETTAPGTYDCSVEFKWMDATFADSTQQISVEVKPKVMAVDIKPESCPNPINVNKRGVTPVAILGTDAFDVTTIDPESVTLEGVRALRWSIEDVGTPYALPEEPGADSCHEAGADGFADLSLKFDTQEVIDALDSKDDGEVLTLTVNGMTVGGVHYEGQDVVLILNKKK